MKQAWAKARRIVVKIGSSLLIDPDSGTLRRAWLATLVADMAELVAQGRQVILVSSGAIGLGRRDLGLPKGPLRLEESQAAAAVGQVRLAHAYAELLAAHGLKAAQVLVTLGDTEERRRYLNARNTMSTLLRLGVVPVVNENDTVATSEIRYGDNDRLAARVAGMMSADWLVLLSDVDGLYTAPPGSGAQVRRLDRVPEITPEIVAMAGATGTDYGKGGMITKVEAARIAQEAGTHMVITSGQVDHPLRALAEGAPCTWFPARANPVTARKRWIGGILEPAGEMHIDAGAVSALAKGKSLLPAGITRVSGQFQRGDAVIIRAPDGRELGRGLSAYSREDAERIIGHKSEEIAKILGYRGRTEMIHRDDMVLLTPGKGATVMQKQ